MQPTFKLAFGSALVGAAMAFSGAASALTLNTSGLKCNSVLTFNPGAVGAFTAAKISMTPLGNMTQLPDKTVIGEDGTETTTTVFNQPITKASVSIGWDLKITPTAGEAQGSALLLVRGANSAGVNAALANFNVDFAKKTVFADIITKDYTNNTYVTAKNAPLYSFEETIPSKISLKGFVLNQTSQIGSMFFTTEAQQLLGDGLKVTQVLRDALAQIDNGVIDISVTSYKRTPKLPLNRAFTSADIPALQ